MITPFQREVLGFIRENPGCSATDLAVHLKPDAVMHRKCSNQGNGACQGKAAWLWGGSVVGKLRRRGWVRVEYGSHRASYWLTASGLEALR